jgi:integrase
MSTKFSKTTADHLSWSEAMNLIRNLYNEKNFKMSLLISLGCFFGLRISDILSLTWKNVYDLDEFSLVEHKTGKTREIKINSQLKRHILDCYQNIKPRTLDEFIFTSQKGSVYSIQRINVI